MAVAGRQQATEPSRRRPSLAAWASAAPDHLPRVQLAHGFGVAVRAIVLLTVLAMLRWDTVVTIPHGALNDLTILTLGYLLVSTGASSAGLRGTRADLVWTSLDILLITWIVWLTGGLRSDYYLLYYLPILQAGLVLRLRDALSAAVLATVCYVFVGTLQQFDATVQTPAATRVIAFAVSGSLVAVLIEVSARRLLQYKSLTDQLERALKTLSAAYEVVKSGTPTGGVPFVCATLVEATTKLVSAERVVFLAPGDQQLVVTASSPSDPLGAAPHFGAAEDAWQCAQSAAQLGVTPEPLHHDHGALECVSFPIAVHGRAFGVLQVLSRATTSGAADWDAVSQLANEGAVVLENVALREEVQRLATEDYATGVWNRREIERLLGVELARAARHGLPLAVAMLDIDDFKQVNDTLGHMAGDGTLRELGDFLKSTVRATDFAGRFGGDEFLLVLPHTDLSNAVATANRIREQWGRLRADGHAGEPPATLSVGVAALRGDELTRDELVDRADRALYEAKSLGKNRLCIWDGRPKRHAAQFIRTP